MGRGIMCECVDGAGDWKRPLLAFQRIRKGEVFSLTTAEAACIRLLSS